MKKKRTTIDVNRLDRAGKILSSSGAATVAFASAVGARQFLRKKKISNSVFGGVALGTGIIFAGQTMRHVAASKYKSIKKRIHK